MEADLNETIRVVADALRDEAGRLKMLASEDNLHDPRYDIGMALENVADRLTRPEEFHGE